MAQAASEAGDWWSGAGSNCRPSAFQKVCHRPWHICRKKLDRPSGQHTGLSGACGSSLAGVPTCAGECRFVRVTGVLAIRDARTCVALVLTSQNRLSTTRAPPAQARLTSPAAYDAQPQYPPPWPTRLPEPAKRDSHTVTSGIVGSEPGRTDRRIGAPRVGPDFAMLIAQMDRVLCGASKSVAGCAQRQKLMDPQARSRPRVRAP